MSDPRLADTSFAQWLDARQRAAEPPAEEAQEAPGSILDESEGIDSGSARAMPQCPRCGQYVGSVGHPCGCLA
jgi:hypothetical protein